MYGVRNNNLNHHSSISRFHKKVGSSFKNISRMGKYRLYLTLQNSGIIVYSLSSCSSWDAFLFGWRNSANSFLKWFKPKLISGGCLWGMIFLMKLAIILVWKKTSYCIPFLLFVFCLMVFKTTFNNISVIQYTQRFLARNHLGRCFFAVKCHKISVKCRWNHGETFTAKLYKLGPKCRWNILIVGDNTVAKIIRVYTYM